MRIQSCECNRQTQSWRTRIRSEKLNITLLLERMRVYGASIHVNPSCDHHIPIHLSCHVKQTRGRSLQMAMIHLMMHEARVNSSKLHHGQGLDDASQTSIPRYIVLHSVVLQVLMVVIMTGDVRVHLVLLQQRFHQLYQRERRPMLSTGVDGIMPYHNEPISGRLGESLLQPQKLFGRGLLSDMKPRVVAGESFWLHDTFTDLF
mmetsp:Transcript_35806/g.112027  ORF Transcript_35806/g.112027 Transcript_35806/m.112027 type:complete len:204 (-) Transcript_35806:680-1291(-)